MIEKYEVTIVGTAPMIMHSSQGIDPSNKFGQKMKEITKTPSSKRTEAQNDELRKWEWFGGLYCRDRDAGDSTKASEVALPADVLMAVINSGAKIKRLGKTIESGVVIEPEFVPLIVPGTKPSTTLGEMYADDQGRYVYYKAVAVQRQRIMRMRPRIPPGWSLTCPLTLFTKVVNPKEVRDHIEQAGLLKGIGDRRPRYGRFEVTDWKKVKA